MTEFPLDVESMLFGQVGPATHLKEIDFYDFMDEMFGCLPPLFKKSINNIVPPPSLKYNIQKEWDW